jgi:hypothetical protein
VFNGIRHKTRSLTIWFLSQDRSALDLNLHDGFMPAIAANERTAGMLASFSGGCPKSMHEHALNAPFAPTHPALLPHDVPVPAPKSGWPWNPTPRRSGGRWRAWGSVETLWTATVQLPPILAFAGTKSTRPAACATPIPEAPISGPLAAFVVLPRVAGAK